MLLDINSCLSLEVINEITASLSSLEEDLGSKCIHPTNCSNRKSTIDHS